MNTRTTLLSNRYKAPGYELRLVRGIQFGNILFNPREDIQGETSGTVPERALREPPPSRVSRDIGRRWYKCEGADENRLSVEREKSRDCAVATICLSRARTTCDRRAEETDILGDV